ncbi:TetR/AcrR family transcriptional regulator C-terminal domain-containing protein [Nocardia callitridis]|uniref:TetR/AcrR family transcriptional regulator n=1 Tax=Nocardia callitridis TaxID=648753 RepID=A0ABP9KH09_9NOCA
MSIQISSVWTREPRQPKNSGLRREQIVTGAVEILDAEGLEALTMRKLGAKLGAGATSVYWYVANKDELLELALDEFWGMLHLRELGQTSWREVLTTYAYELRALMRAHPWAPTLIGRAPSIGPNSLRLNDGLRRACVAAGFDGIDIYLATGTVVCFVLGQVLPETAWDNMSHGEEIDTESLGRLVDVVAADYPDLREDYHVSAQTDSNTARAMAFDFGLLCVMDGLEARLRAAAGPLMQPGSATRSHQ